MEQQTATVLVSILQMLKQQAIYMHRQHGWMIALAETLRDNPEVAKRLEQQTFYDQGPRKDVDITETMIRNIDALIQQLSQ
jgi:hypothetical protein